MKLSKSQKRKILQGMKARLSARGGWIKGGFHKSVKTGYNGVGFCLAGAANDAARELGIDIYGDNGQYDNIVKALSIDALAKAKLVHRMGEKTVAEKIENQGVATYVFNDASKTRKADILALVDEKIAELG